MCPFCSLAHITLNFCVDFCANEFNKQRSPHAYKAHVFVGISACLSQRIFSAQLAKFARILVLPFNADLNEDLNKWFPPHVVGVIRQTAATQPAPPRDPISLEALQKELTMFQNKIPDRFQSEWVLLSQADSKMPARTFCERPQECEQLFGDMLVFMPHESAMELIWDVLQHKITRSFASKIASFFYYVRLPHFFFFCL